MVCYFALKNLIILLIFYGFDLGMTKFLGLKCLTCKSGPRDKDTNDLDKFRVSYDLKEPGCELDPVECSDGQNVCVMVITEVLSKN